jgi:hypothetical protein
MYCVGIAHPVIPIDMKKATHIPRIASHSDGSARLPEA